MLHTKGFRALCIWLILGLFSVKGAELWAQAAGPTTATITLDPYTGLPDKPAPIDAPFNLVMPIDSNFKAADIYQIMIYEGRIERNGGMRFVNFVPNANGSARTIFTITHSAISSGAVKFRIAKTGKDFDQLTICVPPIRPGTYIIPAIQFDLDAATIKLLNENNTLRFNHDGHADAVYTNTIYSRFSISLNNALIQTPPDAPDAGRYATFYTSSIVPLLNTVTGTTTHVTDILNALDRIHDDLAGNLNGVRVRLACCRCGENPFLRDTNTLLLPMRMIDNFLDPANYSSNKINIAKGRRPFTEPLSMTSIDICGETEFDKRTQNIKAAIAGIKSLNRLIDLLRALKNDSCGVSDASLVAVENALNNLQDAYAQLNTDIETYNKNVLALYKSSAPGVQHFKVTVFFSTGDNYPIDIKTAAGNIIQPEVDVALMVPVGKNVQSRPLIRPYWGINIGGPINKQTRQKRIPYTSLRNYLSMTVGFTAIPLAADNRVDVKDLFHNFSFLNGISVRPSRLFRISAGYVLYKEYVPVPFNSDGKVTAMPYLSFNIDLDVWNYTNLGGKLF